MAPVDWHGVYAVARFCEPGSHWLRTAQKAARLAAEADAPIARHSKHSLLCANDMRRSKVLF